MLLSFHSLYERLCRLCERKIMTGLLSEISLFGQDSTGKQENVLLYNADVTPQRIPRKGADVGQNFCYCKITI